jgi:hypothetical protein
MVPYIKIKNKGEQRTNIPEIKKVFEGSETFSLKQFLRERGVTQKSA